MGVDYGFKFREYDSRTGRFFSIDPLTIKSPSYSPYSFAGDKPTIMVDDHGKEEKYYRVAVNIDGQGKISVMSSELIKTEGSFHIQNPFPDVYDGAGHQLPWAITPDKYHYEISVFHKVDGKEKFAEKYNVTVTPSKKDSRTKEEGSMSGWIEITKEGDGGDEQKFNKNAGRGSEYVDAGAILSAFNKVDAIYSERPSSFVDVLEYFQKSLDILNDNKSSGLFEIPEVSKGKGKIDYCTTCEKYYQDSHETKPPEAGTKVDTIGPSDHE